MLSRKQIEKAEALSELMGQRKVMSQFRRMDRVKHNQQVIDRLLDNEKDQAAKVEARLLGYERHTRRLEKMRQDYVAHLITEGVVEATPGFVASEFYKRPAKKMRRIPNTQKEFTSAQMEIALRSLEKPVYRVEYGA